MKRTLIRIEDVAARDTLGWAFWRAAKGKRHSAEVSRFAADLDGNIDRLQAEILAGTIAVGEFRRFEIQDPKRRTIHAPLFRERVLHHALMAFIEPVIERYLVDDTYACRPGKGGRAAVLRVGAHLRHWPWYLQMDVRSYFASIDHDILRRQIRRRIKGRAVLRLLDRILASHQAGPGRGLPIGALTSQHLANLYLATLDRYLLETLRVGGLVRYMDDIIVWHPDRAWLRQAAGATREQAAETLRLEIKPSWRLQRSARGLTFAGLRIYPERVRLTARRRRRYRLARSKWEALFRAGAISAEALQAGYASALAMTRDADAVTWRWRQLCTSPTVDA